MSKILEKILEPSKIYAGSSFLLKIKAIRHLTYEEVKTKRYNIIKNRHTYKDLKGE